MFLTLEQRRDYDRQILDALYAPLIEENKRTEFKSGINAVPTNALQLQEDLYKLALFYSREIPMLSIALRAIWDTLEVFGPIPYNWKTRMGIQFGWVGLRDRYYIGCRAVVSTAAIQLAENRSEWFVTDPPNIDTYPLLVANTLRALENKRVQVIERFERREKLIHPTQS
jgi:hypothetical protein